MGTALVTGALGFIGRAVCDRLVADGHAVRGVDLHADPDRHVVAGDITQPGLWEQEADGAQLVIHTAAIVSMRSDLDEIWRVNTAGTRRVVAAAAAGGAQRFVHLSSVTVFGNAFPDGVDETHPVRLTGVPYADAKIASEQVVLQAHAAGEIPATVVRPGDVYGPGSKPWVLTPLYEMRRGRMRLPAGGLAIHSPIYIDDLVEGIARAAGTPEAAGQVITLSGGVGVTTGDYFGALARMLGKPAVPTAPTRALRTGAGVLAGIERARGHRTEMNPAAVDYLTRTGTYGIERARAMLGWEPKVDLAEGMRRTEAWLREERLL